jgi:hypothetical protein
MQQRGIIETSRIFFLHREIHCKLLIIRKPYHRKKKEGREINCEESMNTVHFSCLA